MMQLFSNRWNSANETVSAPCPSAGCGRLLARSRVPLISTGTQRMLLDFGQANSLEKTRQQSEGVRMAREKIKTDSLLATIESVGAKLDQPIPLGYSNDGVVPGLSPISELRVL